MNKRKTTDLILLYSVLTLIGIVMIYPLLWMISATFKTNSEVTSGLSLLVKEPDISHWLTTTAEI